MRKPYLAGNWKMNLDRESSLSLARTLAQHLGERTDVDVAVAPPFVYLEAVIACLKDSPIRVGAQNMCSATSGAFTGEISILMLKDLGADFVILGHSERRHVYGETDAQVNAKLKLALANDLDVVLCLGETIDERQAKQTESTVRRQLTAGLEGVESADMQRVTLAYEPVWAIGTGLTASPEQASETHQYLRGLVEGLYDPATAGSLRIQYGGSVKASNVAELMAIEDVDGALVGGASLKAEAFLPIIDFNR